MRGLSLLIKPVSGKCNLRCEYCFYADVTRARAVRDYGVMSLETLETIVKNALSEVTQLCAFGFQGGEPMLAGLPFYEALIEFQKKHNARRVEIINSIQTNGTLIDEGWARFFAKRRFLVGLSIDGAKDVHDQFRLDARGKGTHAQCMKAVAQLRRENVEFNILSVVTKQCAQHPLQLFRFYQKHDLRHVQLIPCLDGLEEAHGANPYSLTGEQYGRFLCQFFDLWYAEYRQGEYVSVRYFDNLVRMLLGEAPENCAMRGRCESYPVIEADGSVFPCDFYMLDAYKLGNVQRDSFAAMLTGERAKAFERPSHSLSEECRACRYHPLCRGGCRRDREPITQAQTVANHYCQAYKLFFEHALPGLEAVARSLRR